MLDGNRPPYRMFIDLGVPWQPEKEQGMENKVTHMCTQRRKERDGGHGDIGDKPRTNNKSSRGTRCVSKAQCCFGVFLFLFFAVLYLWMQVFVDNPTVINSYLKRLICYLKSHYKYV